MKKERVGRLIREPDEKIYHGSRALAARLGVSHPYALKLLRARQITHQVIAGACRVRESAVREFEERTTVLAAAAESVRPPHVEL